MLNDRFVNYEGTYRRERTPTATGSSDWVVVDASGKALGRLASGVAAILRGKHKPNFTPNVNMGDNVIVINADKIILTGRKKDQKVYRRHSGYPGGLKTESYRDVVRRDPAEVVLRAIQGMIPHTHLGNDVRTRVRVYAGPEHPHAAQTPRPVTIPD
jgi:large subunit ribosomal protein L13